MSGMILVRQDRPNRPLRTGSSEGAFVFAAQGGEREQLIGCEPNARVLPRKLREASRGSPRSFVRKSSELRMTT